MITSGIISGASVPRMAKQIEDGVFSRDQKRAFKVAKAMEAGGAVINGASFFRAFEMPFGGWKHSGIGTEGVMSTFDEMTRVKNIVLKNIYE